MLKFVLQGVSFDLLLVVVPHDAIPHLLTLEPMASATWRDIREAVMVSLPKTQ